MNVHEEYLIRWIWFKVEILQCKYAYFTLSHSKMPLNLFFNLMVWNHHYQVTYNYHHINDDPSTSFLMVWRQVHFQESSYLCWLQRLCICIMCQGKQEPTGGLPLPERGSEVGSKVTKSISCELLRASSSVTQGGSQAQRFSLALALLPSLVFFLSSFISPCKFLL